MLLRTQEKETFLEILLSLLVACVLGLQQIGIEQVWKSMSHHVMEHAKHEHKEHQHEPHTLEDRWRRKKGKNGWEIFFLPMSESTANVK